MNEGVKNGRHKLSQVDVDMIRALSAQGKWGWRTELARLLGVSTSTISRAARGDSWKETEGS